MEKVQHKEDLTKLNNNTFVGSLPEFTPNTTITFTGTNNILYCEENVRLSGKISFNGSNSLVALGTNRHLYKLNLDMYNNCSFCCGRNVYFNGSLSAIASEQQVIVIGNKCLMSFGIWIRTADPHLIYDATTKKRINPSRSVVIGDHVWVGQGAYILKGSIIGSGSIIGAGSVVAGKTIPSNSAWGGNPARQLRDDIFWDESCVHAWQEEETKSHLIMDTREFIYGNTTEMDSGLDPIMAALTPTTSATQRLKNILNPQSSFFQDGSTNRFFIPKSDK